MRDFTCSTSVKGLPYHRVEYTLLSLPDTREHFVRAAAEFFVQSWMSSALPKMLGVWQCWETALQEDRQDYQRYLDHLFSGGILVDDPRKGVGRTEAMATFSETMLRWLRKQHSPLHVEPEVPRSPEYGEIDLIEITGTHGDYASMQLTMWEVKSSDTQASGHNDKIYKQLKKYPRRFYAMANSIATRYKDDSDYAFKHFLQNMSRMVMNRQPQVHYGVFITYDAAILQEEALVPNLHKYPVGHPISGECCHQLALFLVPNFRQLRLDVWQCLHLM